jgi:hypothetical protein
LEPRYTGTQQLQAMPFFDARKTGQTSFSPANAKRGTQKESLVTLLMSGRNQQKKQLSTGAKI